MAERLQKVLSQWGLASRRRAEAMIAAGRIRVNGAIAQLGDRVDPAVDRIECDGRWLQPEARPAPVYLLLHKPLGVVSTCDDPQGRPTVVDFLPAGLQTQGIHPVGRLDVESTGALILTNDGELTYGLTHPRHDVSKTYRVTVQGIPSPATLAAWRQGIVLDGRKTRPATIRLLSSSNAAVSLLEIVLQEGRNRQIRRVADRLGHAVVSLHRTAIGPVRLGNLPAGQIRSLTPDELSGLLSSVHASAPPDSSVSSMTTAYCI